MRLFAAVCLTSSLFAFAAPASARERIAVATFKLLGDNLSAPARNTLRSSLVGGLAAAGFDVVPDEDMARVLKQAPGLSGCDTTTCLKRLGELLGLKRVLKAQLELLGTSNYVFNLEVIDIADGTPAAHLDDGCQVCTLQEANDALSNAAAALRTKLEPATPQPPPALPPVVVTPPVTPPVEHHGRPYRWGAVAALAAGAAGLATGIALLAIDGREVGSHFDSGVLKIDRYDTFGGGVALTVIGIGLAATSGALFWMDTRRGEKKVTLIPSVAPGAAALFLNGRF